MRNINGKIRVLHVISDTYSVTGPANSLLTLMDHLPRNRYDAYVALREAGSLSAELAARKGKYFFLSLPKPSGLNALRFLLNLPLAIRRLVRFARQHRIDLIHVHQSVSLWGLIAGKLAGIPVVLHAREILENRLFYQILLGLSAQTIAISNAVRACLIRNVPNCPECRISVVYNAADLTRFRPDNADAKCLRSEWGILKDAPLVLMVSKLIEIKGHLDFVKSCALCQKRFPNAVFMIVGGDMPGHEAYAERVRQAVREYQLEDAFHFAGFQREVERFLGAADVVVQPSICEEGLGRVAIEAMAMGKPVVATHAGGLPEVVQDGITGYIVPKNDHEALAGRIIAFLENPDLCAKMGQAGRVRAHQQFGVLEHVASVAEIYDKLLCSESSQRRVSR